MKRSLNTKRNVVTTLLLLTSISVFCQPKQANTIGSEVMSDIPYKIIKYDSLGNLNSIPVFIYIHDSNGSIYENDLIDISISIKNASDTTFNPALTFSSYSDTSFQNLFSCKSVYDSYFDVQDFDSSLPIKDASKTIKFTSDTNWWIPPIPLVQITQTHWYFVFTIPSEKLAGFNDIVDIRVVFNLDYATDESQYFRVFRYNDTVPEIKNWYRGDTHFHGLLTSNTAEIGFPLDASKIAARYADLDWITVTDHSCDYDNYGSSLNLNWQKLGEMIQLLNSTDNRFIYIRGVEMSINNSTGDIVHALTYPQPDDPFNMNFSGDGGGDLSGTSVSIDDLVDSLSQSGGFVYAAHPFSEGDKLSDMVGGNVWNLGQSEFPANDSPAPSSGIVICNDTLADSDIFSSNPAFVFKSSIAGGQIWNLRNSLQTTDESYDPWNANYSSVTPFAPLDTSNILYHMKRLRQNMDIIDFIWKKSLQLKNGNPALQNWKFFISAGSDAHGSFNYANTDMTMEITGNINDNAPGKLFTVAYCPAGMGSNGENVLHALKNGHTVISDGPLLTMRIVSGSQEIIIGQDTVINSDQISQAYLIIQNATSDIYGIISSIAINGYTQDSIFSVNIPLTTDSIVLPFDDILLDLFGTIPMDKYFILTARMETIKDYGSLSDLYKNTEERFHCFTNPVYLKINNISSVNHIIEEDKIKLYPNPCDDVLHMVFNKEINCITNISIYDITMQKINNHRYNKVNLGEIELQLSDRIYKPGLYFIEIISCQGVYTYKVIKQ